MASEQRRALLAGPRYRWHQILLRPVPLFRYPAVAPEALDGAEYLKRLAPLVAGSLGCNVGGPGRRGSAGGSRHNIYPNSSVNYVPWSQKKKTSIQFFFFAILHSLYMYPANFLFSLSALPKPVPAHTPIPPFSGIKNLPPQKFLPFPKQTSQYRYSMQDIESFWWLDLWGNTGTSQGFSAYISGNPESFIPSSLLLFPFSHIISLYVHTCVCGWGREVLRMAGNALGKFVCVRACLDPTPYKSTCSLYMCVGGWGGKMIWEEDMWGRRLGGMGGWGFQIEEDEGNISECAWSGRILLSNWKRY